ncbi:PREDICTED: uncharacterized protein LOC104273719, partial [Apaloderma vittatum]|uniref:uncharacterized protein LOC104273719 n=1 Tax=Apaloderma vittatum TaxID=57397 RepID=UPI0005211EF7
MNKKEDLTQQNTSESDNDEVDGNNICGFRKKKGVKGPTKYVHPLENEKMELSHTSKTPDPCPLRGTTACTEPPPDQPLQNLTGFSPVQKDREGRVGSSTCSDVKEDMSGESRESQENADNGKRVIRKMHEEVDTPGKVEQPAGVQPARSRGKAGGAEATHRGEGSGKAEGKQEEWGGMEVVKFHLTKTGSLGSAVTTQGGGTADFFEGAHDISKRSLQELKNLLSESPLPAHGPNYSAKGGGTFSQKNLKPREKMTDKQSRPFETFSPHFGEENWKYHSFSKDGVGQQNKPLLVLSSAGSDQQQPAGSDADQLILGLPAASTHVENTAPEIQFAASADNAADAKDCSGAVKHYLDWNSNSHTCKDFCLPASRRQEQVPQHDVEHKDLHSDAVWDSGVPWTLSHRAGEGCVAAAGLYQEEEHLAELVLLA